MNLALGATLDAERRTERQLGLAVPLNGLWIARPNGWRTLETAELTVTGTGDAVLARIFEKDSERSLLRIQTLDVTGGTAVGAVDAVLHGY